MRKQITCACGLSRVRQNKRSEDRDLESSHHLYIYSYILSTEEMRCPRCAWLSCSRMVQVKLFAYLPNFDSRARKCMRLAMSEREMLFFQHNPDLQLGRNSLNFYGLLMCPIIS